MNIYKVVYPNSNCAHPTHTTIGSNLSRGDADKLASTRGDAKVVTMGQV